jgi:hypothetical protein
MPEYRVFSKTPVAVMGTVGQRTGSCELRVATLGDVPNSSCGKQSKQVKTTVGSSRGQGNALCQTHCDLLRQRGRGPVSTKSPTNWVSSPVVSENTIGANSEGISP